MTIDTTAPVVTQEVASPSTGVEYAGNTITLTVTLSEAAIVAGTPTLTLNDGGKATYTGGSGTNTLTFSYTVGAGDSNVASLAVTAVNLPNGATVQDAAGNTANLAGALATFAGLQINPPTGVPTISSFSPDSGVVGDHITNVSTLTLTGAAVANSTVNVYDGATLLGTAAANGSGAWSFTTAALASGSHSFTATDTASGITSAASSAYAVTIDTTAPVAPSITSFSPDSGVVGDGITNATMLTVTGTAEANSTVKVYDGATLLGTATANGSGAWSYTTGTLASGTHSLTATATDAAGNVSAASSGLAVTIDTTAPVAPSITSFSPDTGVVGDHITDVSTLTLTGTAESNSTVKVYDGATLLGTASTNGSGAWSYTTAALSSGAHSLTATATDAAGNASTASSAMAVTIDTTAPTVSSITASPANGAFDAGKVIALTIGMSENVTVNTASGSPTLSLNDGGTASYVSGSGTNALVFSYTVLAGENTPDLKVSGINLNGAALQDVAGNSANLSISGVAQGSPAIDTIAPVAPSITAFSPDSGTVGDGITNAAALTLTGTAEANSTVKVYDGATLLGTATASGSGAWTYTTAALSNGAHSLTATATDAAGNVSSASNATAITVDTHVPAAPSITSDVIVNTNEVALTGSAEANSTVKVYDGATLLGSTTANSSGAWSYTSAGLNNGLHNLTATATDAAGTTSAASAISAATISTPIPTITSYSPDSAVVGDGLTNATVLTLSGTAVANSTVKIYDGATLLGSATANSSGAWSLTTGSAATTGGTLWNWATGTIATSALSNGVHNFTATDTDASGNVSAASAVLTVTVDTVAPVAPSITSFSPDTGVVGDHITDVSTLTLTGTAEANSTVKVYDGATLLGSATANGSGAWTYMTAALASGAHSLTATATDAAGNVSTASSAMAVTIDTTAPTVSSITASPASGAFDAGKVITLTIGMSENVTLNTTSASPTLTLNDGGTATYVSGSGTNALVFSYTVLAGQNTPDLMVSAVNLNGATLQDVAGNAANLSISGVAQGSPLIDTTAPVAPSITSFSPDSGVVGDGITNAKVLTLTGTAEANSTVKVYDGADLLGSATANGSGAWTYTTTSLNNGAHNLTATATDAAGNMSSASSAFVVTIDTTAPVAPSITSFSPDSGVVGDGITNATVLTLTGTAEANSTVKVYDGANLLGSATANGSGAWTIRPHR